MQNSVKVKRLKSCHKNESMKIGKPSVCMLPVKCLKSDCNSESIGILGNGVMTNSSNLDISSRVVFSLNEWTKRVGSPSLFRRKQPFIPLNSSAFIKNLSSSECAHANHTKNDAQKGCAVQLNGITLSGH